MTAINRPADSVDGKHGRIKTSLSCFSVDLITSLVLASSGDIRRSEVVEKVILLKRTIPFEMEHLGRIVSTQDEIRKAVEELLAEGVSDGWLEATVVRYSDEQRKELPERLKELLEYDPSLKDTLDRILARVGLAFHQLKMDRPHD